MDLKLQITEVISKTLGWSTDTKTLSKNMSVIWQNPRKKDEGGLRLTEKGYQIFLEDMELKSYEVDFPKEFTLTNQVVIWLDKFIDGPYYLDKKSIIVFKEKTAVQLILFAGDVQKFGLAKAMSLKSHS